MGGSGGGSGGFEDYPPSRVQEKVREGEEAAAEGQFLPRLAALLDGYLAVANQRDTRLVQHRLDGIKAALRDELEEGFDLLFGGSVAKHTYVDGISDIDSLLVFREASDATPGELKQQVAKRINQALPDARVSTGRLAVTVGYRDGMEVQLIPAARTGRGLRVPSWHGDRWSRIDPVGFKAALTKCNEANSGKLIPTIKLAKAINANLLASRQLTGYHIESLGIAAFRQYSGEKTTSRMLPYFCEEISKRVLSPVRDSTGQSVHGDEYLGRIGSKDRKLVAQIFERIAKRMRNATAAQSESQWRQLFEGD